MLEAKSDERLYFKTDTHWTPYGAFLAYQKIMEAYGHQGLDANSVDDKRVLKDGVEPRDGDLYGMLGVNNRPETTDRWVISDSRQPTYREILPAYEWKGRKAYQLKMTADENPSLLIFGDSFASCAHPISATIIRENYIRSPPQRNAACGIARFLRL